MAAAACRLVVWALVPLLAGPARADCESGIGALAPRLASVSDTRLHAQLLNDLKRAQFELWEFDEVECAIALEHADRLLKTGN